MKLPAFLTTLPVLVKNIYKKNTCPVYNRMQGFFGLGKSLPSHPKCVSLDIHVSTKLKSQKQDHITCTVLEGAPSKGVEIALKISPHRQLLMRDHYQ